jgi:hypothetical protein
MTAQSLPRADQPQPTQYPPPIQVETASTSEARQYEPIPGRPAIEVLKDTAAGRRASMVIDSAQARELLAALTHAEKGDRS